MKLSQGIEWAAHICTLLAVTPGGEPLAAERCAEFYELPPAYLRKHLRQLVEEGVLTATPGPAGGYALARPAEKITLWDIVEAIEGGGRAFRCTEIRQRGPTGLSPDCYRGRCGIARAMWAAEDAWRTALKQTSVADLVATARREAPRKQKESARAWLLGSPAPASPSA